MLVDNSHTLYIINYSIIFLITIHTATYHYNYSLSTFHVSAYCSILPSDISLFFPYFSLVVYPLPWPLLVGGVRCSRLWSTSQLLSPSGQQCSHSGGVCPQIQGRQCGAYVGAVEEMMCVMCVDVTEGA